MRDLDDRVLGQRGVLAVAAILTVTALVSGVAAVARSDVATAVFAFVVAGWFGFWTGRRWRSLRTYRAG